VWDTVLNLILRIRSTDWLLWIPSDTILVGTFLDFLRVNVKVKSKVVPVLWTKHDAMKVILGKCLYSSTHSLTLALDGGEWSGSYVNYLPNNLGLDGGIILKWTLEIWSEEWTGLPQYRVQSWALVSMVPNLRIP